MKARALIERMSPAAPAPAAPPKTKPGIAPSPRPGAPAPNPSKPASPWRDPNIRPGTEPKPKAKVRRPEDDAYGGLPEPMEGRAEISSGDRPMRVDPPYLR